MKPGFYLAYLCWIALCGSVALAQNPSSPTNDIRVVPFSHLDLMWAGTLEECLSRGNRIIAKALEIARAHPEFRFLLEDDDFVANYVEAHRGAPELDEFKRLVKDGRIDLAPKWAAIYLNLPRGEALVRNIIYGKRYARQVFGVDPRVAHFGDIPGFSQQLPQILAQSDIPFMVMTRMGPRDCSLFRYRSPDGSSVLVWNTIKGYGWGVGLGLHHARLDAAQLAKIANSIREVQRTTSSPIYLGWGTDLFAPSENLPGNVPLLNQRLAPMHFRFATPAEFFRDASKVNDLPEFSGEIPSGWGNILTSMCQLWPPAFLATDTLITAEKFAAINFGLGYSDYPQMEFEQLWKRALESMDHNNFGQGGDLGDQRKLEYARMAILRGGEILRQSLRNIAERVKAPFARCTPIVVFNPLSWRRTDPVQAHVSVYGDVSPGDISDYRKAIRLVDETGLSIPFHVERFYGTVSRAFEILFLAKDVPSLGYKTYFIMPADRPERFPNACAVRLDETKTPKGVLGPDQFENEFYRVSVDRATGRVTVFDKQLGRAVIKDAEMTGTEERGGNSIALEPVTGRALVELVNAVVLEENNPVRAVLRIEGDLGGQPLVQKVFLYHALKRVDLETTLDWKQNRLVKIEQVFPYQPPQAKIRYGIPFGSAAADDIFPGSGPRGGDEISREEWSRTRQIQDWVFAGTSDSGVTITADRLPIVLGEGIIKCGLLRGTYSTTGMTVDGRPVLVRVPPAARYVFRYSISSGQGDWTAAKPYRAGLASTNPFIPVIAEDELSTKSLPPAQSFCSVDADNLIVSALKKAEPDDALVVRVVEMNGQPAETPLEFIGAHRPFRSATLLDEPAHPTDEQILRVRPNEIRTLRLGGPFHL